MTSSWREAVVLTGPEAAAPAPATTGGELRTGTWTRLGDAAVLGDLVTERTLAGLAETTRSAARAQGYAIGWAEGRRAAEERARVEEQATAERHAAAEARREAEHAAAVAALQRAAAGLHASVGAACAAVEEHATAVAFTVAEAVVGRELTLAEDPGADAVRRALALLPGSPTATVRLHPADAGSALVAGLLHPGATVVADPGLQRGDAVVETHDQVVDARVATAFERVREVLLP